MNNFDNLIHAGAKSYDHVDALLTTLPAVSIDELIGTWTAVAIPGVCTDYEAFIANGWYGMRFTDRDTVDPLLIADAEGQNVFAADVVKIAATNPAPGTHLGRLRAQIESDGPQGRLRMIEHRGVLTAAMIYDRQPVIDYFRRLDGHAVVCAAEGRGRTADAYSVLQRIGQPPGV